MNETTPIPQLTQDADQSSTSVTSHKIDELKVAIVHDWLIGGGAEKVVLELHKLFPQAPIYTSFATREWRQKLDDKVVTGYLQKWPFSKLRKFIPYLRAIWFSNLDLSQYDLVISSSGAEAKGVKVKGNTKHVNYCHAPTHYYWRRYDEYMASPGFGSFDSVARFGLKTLVGPMRKWDFKAAQRPHYIIANSTYTKDEIKKYYGRDSTVIHPPIDVARFSGSTLPPSGSEAVIMPGSASLHEAIVPSARTGFVITGRQTPYKRIDLAVKACTRINVPLTVIGNGPQHAELVALAGPTITFRTDVTDEEMPLLLTRARAFIFPGIDDFGISPLEAMACGTPVIAFKAGGAMDYVISTVTGEFFDSPTDESLALTIAAFHSERFDEGVIKNKAAEFSPEIFKNNIVEYINNLW